MVQRVEDRVSSMQPGNEGHFGVAVLKEDALASTRVEPRKLSFVPNLRIRGESFFMGFFFGYIHNSIKLPINDHF